MRSRQFNGLGLLHMTGWDLMPNIKQTWAQALGIQLFQDSELVTGGQLVVDCRSHSD